MLSIKTLLETLKESVGYLLCVVYCLSVSWEYGSVQVSCMCKALGYYFSNWRTVQFQFKMFQLCHILCTFFRDHPNTIKRRSDSVFFVCVSCFTTGFTGKALITWKSGSGWVWAVCQIDLCIIQYSGTFSSVKSILFYL